MARIKPYSGTSHDRLVEMINQDNDSNLQEGVDFTIGAPSLYSDGTTFRNTTVTLTPAPGTTYQGPQDIFFRRLNFNVLQDLPPLFVDLVELQDVPFSIVDILPQINEGLGLDLVAEDVINTTYDTKRSTYILTAAAESLAWVGSVAFKVHFAGDDYPLPDVVVVTQLSGLVYRQPA